MAVGYQDLRKDQGYLHNFVQDLFYSEIYFTCPFLHLGCSHAMTMTVLQFIHVVDLPDFVSNCGISPRLPDLS